jgi:predicted phage-related endonuclease
VSASGPRTVARPLSRDEWLAARRPWFNASAAAVLWDRHPFLDPGDYATVKLTGKEQEATRAMQRGLRLEDVIAQWWADDHRCKVVEPDVLHVRGRVMATVDRMVLDTGMPVEIKNPSRRVREPEQYWIDQCQAIMWTVDTDEIVLVWFDSSMEIHDRVINRDPEFGPELARRADEFMAAIDLGIVPDWVTLSYDNIAALHPDPAGRVVLDNNGLELVRKLDTIRLIRRDAEADEKRVKDELARLLGEAAVGTWAGLEVLTWKAIKGTRVLDHKRLAEDHPDLVAEYMVDRPGTRRMLVHLGTGDE